MSAGIVLIVMLAILFGLLLIGVPVGLSLIGTATVMLFLQLDPQQATSVMGTSLVGFLSLNIIAIPLFILKGELLFAGGTAQDIFDAASAWLRRLPGGLAVVSIAAAAVFGSIAGSSIASTAIIGQMTVPEMIKRGYSPRLATGAVASAGGLAQLIPPSVMLIFYASIAEVSVAKLLMAAVVPALLLGIGFATVAFIWATIHPGSAPREPAVSWSERFRVLPRVIRPAFIIIGIVAVIFSGIATATEAAGVGSLVAFVFALFAKDLGTREIFEHIRRAARTSAYILIIALGGSELSWVVSYNQVPARLINAVGNIDFPNWGIMLLIMGVYLLLGMVIDPIGMLVITLPIVLPLVVKLGYDPVWFGVLLMVNLELALIHPPIGMGLMVVKGVSPKWISLSTIFGGAMIFASVDFLLLGALVAFPNIALWLPGWL